MIRIAAGVVATAAGLVLGGGVIAPAVWAAPSPSIKAERIAYVDEHHMDITVTYTCAKGGPKFTGLSVQAVVTKPVPRDDRDVANVRAKTDKITCNGAAHTEVVHASQYGRTGGPTPWPETGEADVEVNFYGGGDNVNRSEVAHEITLAW